MSKESKKLIANNKKAYHEYFLEEKYEAGIALHGTEVKSLRMGKCSIKEAFVRIENDEVIIYQMHISPYEKDGLARTDPRRERQLLMHKREILRLFGKIKQDGLTLIPLNLHWSGSNVKVQIGLCKGKKLYDKRQSAAEQAAKRQIDRTMKSQYR